MLICFQYVICPQISLAKNCPKIIINIKISYCVSDFSLFSFFDNIVHIYFLLYLIKELVLKTTVLKMCSVYGLNMFKSRKNHINENKYLNQSY